MEQFCVHKHRDSTVAYLISSVMWLLHQTSSDSQAKPWVGCRVNHSSMSSPRVQSYSRFSSCLAERRRGRCGAYLEAELKCAERDESDC